MKLKDWLAQESMTQEAFGQLIHSDQGHVSDLVRGKVRPRLDSVARIELVTRGAVTAQDWLDAAPRAPKPKRVRLDKLKAAVKKVVR